MTQYDGRVEAIRKMHVEGERPAEIAAALGASRMSEWRVLNVGAV
jgi:hypothetical protein